MIRFNLDFGELYLKFGVDIGDTCKIITRYLLEYCRRFAEISFQMSFTIAWNFFETCLKFAWNLYEIYLLFGWNWLNICLWCEWDLGYICPIFDWDMLELFHNDMKWCTMIGKCKDFRIWKKLAHWLSEDVTPTEATASKKNNNIVL